jgi:hypothetical protein
MFITPGQSEVRRREVYCYSSETSNTGVKMHLPHRDCVKACQEQIVSIKKRIEVREKVIRLGIWYGVGEYIEHGLLSNILRYGWEAPNVKKMIEKEKGKALKNNDGMYYYPHIDAHRGSRPPSPENIDFLVRRENNDDEKNIVKLNYHLENFHRRLGHL